MYIHCFIGIDTFITVLRHNVGGLDIHLLFDRYGPQLLIECMIYNFFISYLQYSEKEKMTKLNVICRHFSSLPCANYSKNLTVTINRIQPYHYQYTKFNRN
jgi:hypothetical protein